MVWIAYMQNAKGICFRVHAQVQFILIVYAMLPSHDTLSFRYVRSNDATLPMIIAFHLKALVCVLEIQFVYVSVQVLVPMFYLFVRAESNFLSSYALPHVCMYVAR